MEEVVDYKIKWVIEKDRAKKRIIPIYKDIGKGGGLESRMNKFFIQLTNTDVGRKIA